MLVLSMGAGDIAINVNVDDDPNADWGFQQWGCVFQNLVAVSVLI